MLKGKKRTKFQHAISGKSERYKEAARPLLTPKTGYGLESDLRRAGVYVRTVQYKPQAADVALKKQIESSMNKGIQCICLVSDDSDFSDMLKMARSQNLRTVVFGESNSLRRFADFWFPWDDVAQGLPKNEVTQAIHDWTVKYNAIAQRRIEAPGFAVHRSAPFGQMYTGIGTLEEYGDVQHSTFMGNTVATTKVSVFSEEEEEAEMNEMPVDGEWFLDDDEDEGDEGWESDSEEDYAMNSIV